MHKPGAAADRKSIAYIDGEWHDGNAPLMGVMSHATWMASVVFDGARAFQGLVPDLDRHCARVIRSAEVMELKPTLSAAEIVALAREGVAQFANGAELYIRPMFFAEEGFVLPDPDSTRFAMLIYELAMPEAKGFSACLSRYRRPAPDTAPTEAKASCLYPNVGRMLREAANKGFDTAVALDPLGNVAEFATANLFAVKDGIVHTPAINGTFLDGITRQRVIALLRENGQEVVERRVTFDQVLDADEVFCTANYAKVMPATRIEDRHFQAGPVAKKARELYFEFARTQPL